MNSRGLLLFGAVAVLFAVTTLAIWLSRPQPVEPPAIAHEDAPDDTTATSTAPTEGELFSPITRETVEGLYYGLALTDIEEMFGRVSDFMETEYEPGVSGYTSPFVIIWHHWNNEDGSKAKLGFVDNKLYRKQFLDAGNTALLPEPEPFYDPD